MATMSQAKRKVVAVGQSAQGEVFAGVEKVADAVKRTLGPYGRNFAAAVRGGPIEISNDGVTLARYMIGSGANEFEDIGIQAVVEAATKTNDEAGDGTSSAVVLTEALLGLFKTKEGIVNTSLNPMAIKRQVDGEAALVVEKLNAMAEKITSREGLIEVARVSVEDQTLAELIGGAQWDVTEYGTVLAEEHNDPKDAVEFTQGIKFDNGFGTSRIINNQEKQQLELEGVHVIMTNYVFNTAKMIAQLNNLFVELSRLGTKGVVLIGRAFDETAIGMCVTNMKAFQEGKGGLMLYPVNAPYTDQAEIMQDMAAALGGTYVDSAERKVQDIVIGDVGLASKFIARRFEAIVAGKKKGEDEAIDAAVQKRIEDIKEKLKGQVSPFERRSLESRLAQMTVGTALVKVGAQTEQERKYKKAKVDDAVNAVKAAIQEGVVPGAGQALQVIGGSLPEGSLIKEALCAPFMQIQALAPGGSFEVESWVKDPLKVVRVGFLKAVSIAGSLGTMEVAVTHEREKPMWVKQAEVNLAPEDPESF